MAPDLIISRLRKQFGAFTAVDDVSFDVARGSFFSILGPSGCGKTTLLRMIAGFEGPTSGEIVIGGRSMLRGAAQPAAGQPGIPAPRAVSDDERGRQHCLRPQAAWRQHFRDQASDGEILERVDLPGFGDKRSSSSPVARNSGWPSPAAWCWSLPSCCWTNRWGRWT
jgi:spermidine/putrescine transport system ATP-binding protein